MRPDLRKAGLYAQLQKYQFYIYLKYCSYLGKESTCLHAICQNYVIIKSLSIGLMLNKWLIELPAILDRFSLVHGS